MSNTGIVDRKAEHDDGLMDLKFHHTNRGFARYDFKDLYGEACSLQASSLATDAAIWLGCNEAKIDHVTRQPIGPRMHLNREQVATLLPILQHFVMTGEVGNEAFSGVTNDDAPADQTIAPPS